MMMSWACAVVMPAMAEKGSTTIAPLYGMCGVNKKFAWAELKKIQIQ